MFQFYLSSIKRLPWDIFDLTKDGFNSTLVQLKARSLCQPSITSTCFNSTLVQLKDLKPEYKAPTQRCFNSTLVQLKAIAAVIKQNGNKFQFYLSSIKRENPAEQWIARNVFQFYLSSIKRMKRV